MMRTHGDQAGFSLVELLVVFVVVGILAAIAAPIYLTQRDKAKESALKLNARNVRTATHAYAADGLNPSWQASHALTNGTLSSWASTYISCALEENIKQGRVAGANGEGYNNPYSGKTLVLNQAALPSGGNAQPAVYITQPSSTTYRYATFPTNATTKAGLAGSVVVCWNTSTSNIEIFSVDKTGKKSAVCQYIPM
jgi:prepilin-type N-terminal cleavage/methylation domain-containing protein